MTSINIFRHTKNVKTFAANQVIFAEGQPGDMMYVVLEGMVEVQQAGMARALIGPGGLVGEMALIDHAPRSASAVARTACDLACISEAEFLRAVQVHPYFALDVMRVLVERLRLSIGESQLEA